MDECWRTQVELEKQMNLTVNELHKDCFGLSVLQDRMVLFRLLTTRIMP